MIQMNRISAPEVLNEAPEYGSAFSRAVSLSIGDGRLVVISGTASVGPQGQTLHVGDFPAQVEQTYRNISALLATAGVTWRNVIKITTFLRDIDRDYKAFNQVRNAFFSTLDLPFPPAATCVEAKLCRPELLVEMELIVIVEASSSASL